MILSYQQKISPTYKCEFHISTKVIFNIKAALLIDATNVILIVLQLLIEIPLLKQIFINFSLSIIENSIFFSIS